MICEHIQSRFSSYLDGALTGAEMHTVAAHLDACTACRNEFRAWQGTHALVTGLGRREAPADLALKLRVALSQERARSMHFRLESVLVRAENALRAFMIPAAGGLVTALLMVGVFAGMYSGPRINPELDIPTTLYMPPRLTSSPFSPEVQADSATGPVVVEVIVDSRGRVGDYRILAGGNDPEIRRELDRSLIFAEFTPAIEFGQPTTGKLVLAFANVNVRG